MRLERRLSSMTLVNKFDFRKKLIKIRVLNAWFQRYLFEKKLELRKPLAQYIELVEVWESKMSRMRLLIVSGLILTLLGGSSLCWVYFNPDSHQMDFKYQAFFGVLGMIGLHCLYYGIEAFCLMRKNRPRPVVIQLVHEYRKVLSAVDTTVLWWDFVYAKDTDETEEQISVLQKSESFSALLPEFLVKAAESKLRDLGQQISELEGKYRDGEAAGIRNGIFASCFKHAIMFGVIPENSGFEKFIPPPVY